MVGRKKTGEDQELILRNTYWLTRPWVYYNFKLC